MSAISGAIRRATALFFEKDTPPEYRANFLHLYLDIAWFGLLTGSAISFISVYLVRIGASGFQIGLFSAAPALVALGFALPAGQWLKGRAIGPSVFWTSVFHRFFYLLWIPLPALFRDSPPVWIYVAITFLMSIPGTVLAVGFNALFAETVPVEYRGSVVGIRNALLALTVTGTSLVSGVVLKMLPFPLGYQVIFAVGFLGAAMSSYHLWKIKAPRHKVRQASQIHVIGDSARPGFFRNLGDAARLSVGLRALIRRRSLRLPRFSILRTSFGLVLGGLFMFHFAQHLAIPLFSLYWVGELDFSDQTMSWGNALFYLSMFLGSTRLGRLTDRFGNGRLLTLGATMMIAYPLLTAFTRGPGLYFVTAIIGGLAWAVAGGALGNYLLDKIPVGEQPAYLAWYNLTLNSAVLLGSLGGPLVAEWIGIPLALLVFAGGRLVSAGILFWINRRSR